MSFRSRHQPDPEWFSSAVRDDAGNIVPNVANALLALSNDPSISLCFSFDAMAHDVMLVSRIPTDGVTNNEAHASRVLTDIDATHVQAHLQRNGLPRIGKETIFQAIDARARQCAFHPVRDHLERAVAAWDHASRIETWLCDYLGADDTPYVRAIGRMFLVAMVARVFHPGCQADYAVILEGRQGTGKSTACRILGGDWFSDSLPDLRLGKEASTHLRGRWLIEISELAAFKGAASEMLKSFISRTTERYRPPYGRREVVEQRQCVFIGTTNATAYLHDETGGRRFWPVQTGRIDTDGLAKDRDHLLAEAVKLYRDGFAWWPDSGFEASHIRPQQESRYETDAWQAPIADWLSNKRTVLVKEIAQAALGMEVQRLNTADARRVTAILDRLGWRRGKKDWRGNIPWVSPASESPELRIAA
jgi:predicted P-loop ATPase